jgi:hypothetical protein
MPSLHGFATSLPISDELTHLMQSDQRRAEPVIWLPWWCVFHNIAWARGDQSSELISRALQPSAHSPGRQCPSPARAATAPEQEVGSTPLGRCH